MTQAVIGWEQEEPVPDGHQFNHYLRVQNGRLFLEDLDLTQIFLGDGVDQGLGRTLPSPLEIVYLPLIEQRITFLNQVFVQVIQEVEYNGRFYYTYASKANAAEGIIRTTLKAGAHHEMSSSVDVDITRLMVQRGLLPADRLVLANGFKPAGSRYTANLLQLRQEHPNLVPILEDLGEIEPFMSSGQSFSLGLRQKSYGHHADAAEMDRANSRFGFDTKTLWKAADYVAAAPNLQLQLYHCMVGSQITDAQDFVHRLKPGMEIYAQLRQRHPSLSLFDFGGGMPIPMTLNFEFDYHAFARLLLTTLQEVCRRYRVPEPDVVGEFGRFTTAEHGVHVFKVLVEKENNSNFPWYVIDGSMMSSFPDIWALGEHFICLPLNHLDKPFQQVQLGGITCDSDDVYPPQNSQSPLFLPVETEDLYIGFFSIGAYQEMLGGVKGSKHCVLPEAFELVVERGENGRYQFDILHGQTPTEVLHNLGYK